MPKILYPLWHFDRKAGRGTCGLIGVDEAGRGPFAGPVSAAAVFIPYPLYRVPAFKNRARLFNDSKQIKEEQRESFYEDLNAWSVAKLIRVGHSFASIEEIEALNILGATRLCMERALEALGLKLVPRGGVDPLFSDEFSGEKPPVLLIDGKPLNPFPWEHQAIVKGDGKSLAIASASIVAKVKRDRYMRELAERFPQYDFASNKGYGTEKHRAAILKHGPCEVHRMSFLKNLLAEDVEEPLQEDFTF